MGSAVTSFKVFYFEGAWRPVALLISRETAEGPRVDTLKNERDGSLDAHFQTFVSEFTDLRRDLEDAEIDVTLAGSREWDEMTARMRESVREEDVTENVVEDAIKWARSQ